MRACVLPIRWSLLLTCYIYTDVNPDKTSFVRVHFVFHQMQRLTLSFDIPCSRAKQLSDVVLSLYLIMASRSKVRR